MERATSPVSLPGPVHQVTRAAHGLSEQLRDDDLEVGALLGLLLALRGARGRGRLDGRQAVVELGEAVTDLRAELVERRAHARGVQERGQLGGVPVEVAAEQQLHAADGRVPLGLIEQLLHERAQLAAIPEELLQGARQPAVTVREVLPQHAVQRLGGPLVGGRRAGEQRLELAPHHVHVDLHAGVLERQQADAQGALHDGGALVFRPLPDERGKAGVREGQALHGDVVTGDRHGGRRPRGRDGKLDQVGSFHAPHPGGRL